MSSSRLKGRELHISIEMALFKRQTEQALTRYRDHLEEELVALHLEAILYQHPTPFKEILNTKPSNEHYMKQKVCLKQPIIPKAPFSQYQPRIPHAVERHFRVCRLRTIPR